jgi:hypothetical protein
MMLVGWLVFIELAEVQDAFGLFCGGHGSHGAGMRAERVLIVIWRAAIYDPS